MSCYMHASRVWLGMSFATKMCVYRCMYLQFMHNSILESVFACMTHLPFLCSAAFCSVPLYFVVFYSENSSPCLSVPLVSSLLHGSVHAAVLSVPPAGVGRHHTVSCAEPCCECVCSLHALPVCIVLSWLLSLNAR